MKVKHFISEDGIGEMKKEVKDIKPEISIIKIDVDKNQELASKYQIRGVPTLMLFKNGQQVWKQSGVVQADQLVQIINQNI